MKSTSKTSKYAIKNIKKWQEIANNFKDISYGNCKMTGIGVYIVSVDGTVSRTPTREEIQ